MKRIDRERRFTALRALGCFVGSGCGRVEIHHLNLCGQAGRKRRGDEYTISLCAWHHRGEPLAGYAATQMTAMFGPSLARQSKEFRARYGTDDQLLERVNARIAPALNRATI